VIQTASHPLPDSMRALCIETLGQPLVEIEMAMPVPDVDEVLVRVHAAGICHTDAHLRAGGSSAATLPLIPGHEVAGEIVAVGEDVGSHRIGERVCIHYLVSCTRCDHCRAGLEQFCRTGAMIGARRAGGYAEYIAVPARNAVVLPPSISMVHGAIMMCSSSTALHALRRGRLQHGDTVAVFGVGGLGVSAVQLARACGASQVFAIDRNADKLATAARLGATPIDGTNDAAVARLRDATNGRGVDVVLDLIGHPTVTLQALQMLAIHGRAVAVGIHPGVTQVPVYRTVLGPEVELIGANDHLLSELHELFVFAERGTLAFDEVQIERVPLGATEVNAVLDSLDCYTAPFRTVIIPGSVAQ
jgi:2-desacetyl-2-hydroxyethyl bacteriochlorophyllide A dehydrogenase